jgi:hypothetical protein
MKMRLIFALAAGMMLFLTCKQYKDISSNSIRQVKPSEVAAYHPPIQVNIGWVPYQDQKLVQTGKNEWKVMKDESGKQGAVPVILINYPDSKDSIWIDMNMDNALLGKLIKHSLMTQEPIKRPFSQFFTEANCMRCHPSDVKVNFQ